MPGREVRCALLAIAITALTLTPPDRAAALAEHCSGTPAAAGRVIAAVPWAQQRYAPERLAGIADGTGVTIAVIDSGVDANHPQLAGAVLDGADRLDRGGSGRLDCLGHGTAVASIIAARPASGVGFVGLAPGARILPIRVSEQLVIEGRANGRSGTASGLAAAIRYAVDHGATVLNLSIILNRDDAEVRDAVDYARQHDVVLVAAVGNGYGEGNPTPYPAAYDGVLGVGAVGPSGVRMPGSQVGSYVDLVAPGRQVTAAARVRGHDVYEGTSFATPFVAATAVLIRQQSPGLRAPDVVRRVVATVDPAPGGRYSGEYGYGVLNPYRAVTERLAHGPPPVAVPPLAPAGHDPAVAAASAHRAAQGRRALGIAAGTAVLAALVLFAALALPRGVRRRWRPGW